MHRQWNKPASIAVLCKEATEPFDVISLPFLSSSLLSCSHYTKNSFKKMHFSYLCTLMEDATMLEIALFYLKRITWFRSCVSSSFFGYRQMEYQVDSPDLALVTFFGMCS